jgi:hypothetical protein
MCSLWADYGPNMNPLWTDNGPIVGPSWAQDGPAMGYRRIIVPYGPTMGRSWAHHGPIMCPSRAQDGHLMGRSLAHRGSIMGHRPIKASTWTHDLPIIGPPLAHHEPNHGPIVGDRHIMGPIRTHPSWAMCPSWAKHDMGPYWAQSNFVVGPLGVHFLSIMDPCSEIAFVPSIHMVSNRVCFKYSNVLSMLLGFKYSYGLK